MENNVIKQFSENALGIELLADFANSQLKLWITVFVTLEEHLFLPELPASTAISIKTSEEHVKSFHLPSSFLREWEMNLS